VEVKDVDHSYSITPGDTTREIKLDPTACATVVPYGDSFSTAEATATAASTERLDIPLPSDDLATRANGGDLGETVAGLAGTVGSTVGGTVGGTVGEVGAGLGGVVGGLTGSGSSASAGSGSGSTPPIVAETGESLRNANDSTVNGATFPIDPVSGRPVIAFSERGIPVDPSSPTTWGGGAGGLYLTDGHSSVYAAIVQPLGEVQMRVFDMSSNTWK
jgi:hypothetical protein